MHTPSVQLYTLRDAIAAALADHTAFDLTGNLAGLIGSGVVGAILCPAAASS